MATIVDVAERAGVSISTVSHVVNGTRSVAEKTRQRVLKAIDETGYRQDTLARSLRRSRTDSIGLVLSDPGQPTFADMVRGVEHEAAQADYTLLLAHSGEDPAQEARSLQALAARRVDGLIVAPVAHSDGREIDAIRNSGTPVVLMDRIGSGDAGDQVGAENTRPMRELVEHLLGHGYRSIALAAGDLAVSTIAERHRGYTQALEAAGTVPDPALVITGSGMAADTRAAARRLLSGEMRPQAFVCASTETAAGVMEAADVPGYSVNYRLHVTDPVRFEERIKVSIEHGHGNHLSDDWASTAYWYQTLPSPRASIPPLEQRLPVRPAGWPMPAAAPRGGPVAQEIAVMREKYQARLTQHLDRLAERTRQRGERSLQESEANIKQAAAVRRRYDQRTDR